LLFTVTTFNPAVLALKRFVVVIIIIIIYLNTSASLPKTVEKEQNMSINFLLQTMQFLLVKAQETQTTP